MNLSAALPPSIPLTILTVLIVSFSLRIPTIAVGPLMPWITTDTAHARTQGTSVDSPGGMRPAGGESTER
ncbi:hypothetical protein GCM10027408_05490 [Microbacterium tumbae]